MKTSINKNVPVKIKSKAIHPKYNEMVISAINILSEKNGSSKSAILKYISANYKLGPATKKTNSHLKICLKNGVAHGHLQQVKGTGASGSFKIAKPLYPKTKETKQSRASPKKSTGKVDGERTCTEQKVNKSPPKAKKTPSKKTSAKTTKSPKKPKQ